MKVFFGGGFNLGVVPDPQGELIGSVPVGVIIGYSRYGLFGGVNFIKEDDLLGSPAHCPLTKRVPLITNWLANNAPNVMYTWLGDDKHESEYIVYNEDEIEVAAREAIQSRIDELGYQMIRGLVGFKILTYI